MMSLTPFSTVKIEYIFNRGDLRGYIHDILGWKYIVNKLVYIVLVRFIYGACLLCKVHRQRRHILHLHCIKQQLVFDQTNVTACLRIPNSIFCATKKVATPMAFVHNVLVYSMLPFVKMISLAMGTTHIL